MRLSRGRRDRVGLPRSRKETGVTPWPEDARSRPHGQLVSVCDLLAKAAAEAAKLEGNPRDRGLTQGGPLPRAGKHAFVIDDNANRHVDRALFGSNRRKRRARVERGPAT